MGLLDEISFDLVNDSVGLSNTLRKAKILASALGLPEFREWVDFELSGYPDSEKVPNYRWFRPTNYGTFSGPFQSGLKNVVLPTYNLPLQVKEFAENFYFLQGVGELEALNSDSHLPWPSEMVLLAKDAVQMSGGMILVHARQPIPSQVVVGVLDQVKNKLLDFVLALQENKINIEQLNDRNDQRDVARNLFNINIYGDRNIVASGEHLIQQVEPIQKGDIESLLERLRGIEVEDDDLSELEDAVRSEPEVASGQYGPMVQSWLGKMISKAATNTWKVGVDMASKTLTRAINDFYGF